ncbi:MAG TPA: radical SAM protein [Thermoanaerobaculia bacterium]|nr:radical SAM protein [Thermoanaerobaculia bacterium]
MPRAKLVIWELTRACKLSCIQCTAGALPERSPAELSTYEAYKTIDQIAGLRPEEVIITGGDPLERPDIHQLIDYATRRGLDPVITLSPSPLLTGNTVGKLRRFGLSRIAIAIDASSPERHDAVRGIPGQFGATLMTIRWAHTAEMAIEVNTLVTRRNLHDLGTIGGLLTGLSVDRWNVYFPVPVAGSREEDMLTADEAESAFASISDIAARAPFSVRTFEAPQYRRFQLQKSLEKRQQSLERYFMSGDEHDALLQQASSGASSDRSETVFISHSGEVASSPFLPLTAGNVRYQPLGSICRFSKLFTSLRELQLEGKCGRCEFRRICGGSRARAYAATGNLLAADPLCSYEPGRYAATAPMFSEVIQ